MRIALLSGPKQRASRWALATRIDSINRFRRSERLWKPAVSGVFFTGRLMFDGIAESNIMIKLPGEGRGRWTAEH
jgi:hypothetical protein